MHRGHHSLVVSLPLVQLHLVRVIHVALSSLVLPRVESDFLHSLTFEEGLTRQEAIAHASEPLLAKSRQLRLLIGAQPLHRLVGIGLVLAHVGVPRVSELLKLLPLDGFNLPQLLLLGVFHLLDEARELTV